MAGRDASPGAAPAPGQWSDALEALVQRLGGQAVPAGQVVAELLDSHPEYLDHGIDVSRTGDGPVRMAAGHMAVTRERWDDKVSPVLTGRRVIIALAMDAGVGGPLLTKGIIASLVGRWQPRIRTGLERGLVVWDLLSEAGRALADQQPLLAAALGAPAEWSIRLPAQAAAVVWAPAGDRLAFAADGVIYEATRDQAARRVGDHPGRVLSLGWGTSGVVALCLADGTAELIRAADRTRLESWPGIHDGMLSGDGASGWLLTGEGLLRWTPGRQPASKSVGPAAAPVAVDKAGSHALVNWQEKGILLADTPDGPLPGEQASGWPTSGAQTLASGPPVSRPCALVTIGLEPAVASGDPVGGVTVGRHPVPPVARIASGPDPVTALAADPAGTSLAVATGQQIGVWPLVRDRPPVAEVPGYDSDHVGTATAARDLLDADRDARALAALIASSQLKAPMAIGLFGAWGSGKSFVLNRIRHMIDQITTTEHADGYLNNVRVVRFNAWQYAEVNLWASLVDEVLTEIGPVKPQQDSPQLERADLAAKQAEQDARAKAEKVTQAENKRRSVTRVRRLTWAAAAAAGSLAVVVIAVAVLGASARVAAGYGAAVALLTFASAAAAQVKRVAAQGRDVTQAGQELSAASMWVARQLGSGAVDDARHEVLSSRYDYEVALQEAGRLRQEASQIRELSASPQLGSVLQRMAGLTEYHDQLSLIARTRDRFEEIDDAVTAARRRRDQHPDQPAEDEPAEEEAAGEEPAGEEPAGEEPAFERVVVMIDDLDRCAPEKVVTVLEAVHLLFDFEMFVVVIAVDTRWLNQSLRIRYRQLLGKAGAAPTDYLEKIIQIPLHIMPLDEDMVRGMISALTGVSEADTTPPTTPAATPASTGTPASQAPPADPAVRAAATKRRPPRPPLPAEILRITPPEATAMAAVAPLVGTTPRTVKRYVNTYRLLKARARHPETFHQPVNGIADHEIVAFLLALITGHPTLAASLLPALATPPPDATLETLLANLAPTGNTPTLAGSRTQISAWLAAHPAHAHAPANCYTEWAAEVARFSFTPATHCLAKTSQNTAQLPDLARP